MIIYTNNISLNISYKQLIYDCFLKNNKLYLVCPIYDNIIDISNLYISFNNTNLILNNRLTKNDRHKIDILIYDCNYDNGNLLIQYNDIKKEIYLSNIITKINKKLSLTTLFKDDYKLFTIFYPYYKKQKVEHFYLYYNGLINNDVKQYFNKYNDVTLIEWNFKYWHLNKHHAQIAQINHSLYLFGKNRTKYMIYCDFDEYLFVPLIKLYDFITDHDIYIFSNNWAETINNKIPTKFPIKFKISDKVTNKNRNKNIYNTKSISLLCIHYPFLYSIENPNENKNNIMFHFYKWSGKNRIFDTKYFYTTNYIKITNSFNKILNGNYIYDYIYNIFRKNNNKILRKNNKWLISINNSNKYIKLINLINKDKNIKFQLL